MVDFVTFIARHHLLTTDFLRITVTPWHTMPTNAKSISTLKFTSIKHCAKGIFTHQTFFHRIEARIKCNAMALQRFDETKERFSAPCTDWMHGNSTPNIQYWALMSDAAFDVSHHKSTAMWQYFTVRTQQLTLISCFIGRYFIKPKDLGFEWMLVFNSKEVTNNSVQHQVDRFDARWYNGAKGLIRNHFAFNWSSRELFLKVAEVLKFYSDSVKNVWF